MDKVDSEEEALRLDKVDLEFVDSTELELVSEKVLLTSDKVLFTTGPFEFINLFCLSLTSPPCL